MEVKEGKLVPTKQEHRYDDAEAAKEVITAITESSVTEYAFSGNTFGTPALTAVAAALDPKTDVVAVDFSDIFRTRLRAEIPPALEALAAVLKTKENLKEVCARRATAHRAVGPPRFSRRKSAPPRST